MTRPRTNAGRTGVAVGGVGEHHEEKQAGEDELDLWLDDAVAVAAEKPRRDPRQGEDQGNGDDEETGNDTFGFMKIADRLWLMAFEA
jgi:hypothetical protein